ncbi:hypothetical protein EBB05_30155 (plasmid) [Methylobacterium brachiatum]|nr:hypothetical protein EBB05_30155 [Methylobacterium brachiatum]
MHAAAVPAQPALPAASRLGRAGPRAPAASPASASAWHPCGLPSRRRSERVLPTAAPKSRPQRARGSWMSARTASSFNLDVPAVRRLRSAASVKTQPQEPAYDGYSLA